MDEQGLTLCLSKGGKKFAKKVRMDMQHATVVSARPEPIAGPSNANTGTSHTGTSSDVAQLQSTVDALTDQMAWFVEKLLGDVEGTPSDAENTDTDDLPQAAGVSGSECQAGHSAAVTDPGADTLTPTSCHSQLVSVEVIVRLDSRRVGQRGPGHRHATGKDLVRLSFYTFGR